MQNSNWQEIKDTVSEIAWRRQNQTPRDSAKQRTFLWYTNRRV